MTLTFNWVDSRAAKEFEKSLMALSSAQFPRVLTRAINAAGGKTRTATKRELARQTGLRVGVIHKALKVKKATWNNLCYELNTRGGNISLKYLNPKETIRGVVANPFGRRKLYPKTFLKGGKFPGRKEVKYFDGHVWKRNAPGKRYVTPVASGVYIPKQMLHGAVWRVFIDTFEDNFFKRLDHELRRLIQ